MVNQRRRPAGRLLLCLAIVASPSTFCAAKATDPQDKPATAPAPWERIVDGAFENRGIARTERIGSRWALTILCSGTHTTYLDETTIDLAAHEKGFVQARYRYVDRTIPDPKCFAPPCASVTERRIALEKLTAVAVTPERATEIARECKTSPAPR